MLVGEAEDAIQTKDQLNKFLKEQFNITPNEIKTFYDTIKSEGKDTEATLFNQIFGEFYENQSKADLLALMVEEPSVSQATSSLQEIQINPQGSQSGVTSRRPTLVDILLIVSESVGQLLQEEEYDQAYGVSRKRIKLDPAVIQSKDLINHYRCCMLVGEAEEANKIKDQLKTILNKKFQTKANKIGTFADTIRGKGRYMEAILFDQIAAEFYGNQSKAGLVRISNCAGGIKESIRAMLSRDKGLKPIVRTQVIPLMRDMQEMIRRSDDVSEEDRCLLEVYCLCHIAVGEDLMGDLNSAEKTLKDVIAIMKRVFKDNAEKYLVYAQCLYKLSSTYNNTSQLNEARECYRKAIAAFGKAEDINQ
uniref:uncharacterized protein LOC113474779 n=1 Tax=Ciona intestinalis TaxID=7719 RepID=UPI000EF4E4C9|nr:uncharacterized protein LOC113474779 [Ciona intestinalis]|eukprot:XP_026693000.1 uncharacterized protein LOC113474779 [Ciona intestinalis]